MCGSMEIDGYAFCLGLKSLKLSYEAHPDLQSLIYSVTYLMRKAIFRPKYTTNQSGRVSLHIRPLGELVDMYHNHEATIRHDKVYALLGMSSDDPSAAGLSPDYKISWEQLFQRLVKFLLSEQVSVETWGDEEIAVIKSKGCILGQVSLVERDAAVDDRQNVDIASKNAPRYLGCKKEWSAHWTLQASAKSIRQGDLVCLLQGASRPTIIRLYQGHFAVIMIAASPIETVKTESGCVKWPQFLQSIKSFPRDFMLVWDWEKSPLQDRGEHRILTKANSRVPEILRADLEDHWDQATRLWNMALIFEDAKEYRETEELLREAIGSWERAVGKEHPQVLMGMDQLAFIYKKLKQWKLAEELLWQTIQIRKRVQGADHLDTLTSMANLASTHQDQGHLTEARKLKIMTHLLRRRDDHVQITEQKVVQIARSFDEEVMRLLLERQGDEVQITEGVVKAAAENWRSGKEVMGLLLERRGDKIQITEGVVKAAAGNSESGEEVMRLLLEQKEMDVRSTEDIVVQIAGSFKGDIMNILLDRKENKIQLTEPVVKAAAGNSSSRNRVMTHLLERKGIDIRLTEEMVVQIAGSFDEEVMRLLLDRKEDEVQITEGVVKAAAGNSGSGRGMMKLLLERRGDEIQITEGVIKAAAGNSESGKGVIRLLIELRGDEI